MLALGLLACFVPVPGAPVAAQDGDPSGGAPPDAYLDPTAREFLGAARRHWLEVDRSILSYEARVQQRMSVAVRTPLKDRTVYRAETAARVRWAADSTLVVQVLGAKETGPSGSAAPGGIPGMVEEVFDPTSDRVYFGFVDDEAAREDGEEWIEHPVAPGSERHYRYRGGDTLRLTLPDGRSLDAVEVELIPRRQSVHLLSGGLWIEPSSGALVRAVYRLSKKIDLEADADAFENEPELALVPGIFRPFELDVTLVTVDYSLWDFRYWLPRRMRIEGLARAGIVTAPGVYELSYRILDVVGEDDLASPGTGRVAEDEAETEVEDAAAVVERWATEDAYGEFERVEGERRNEGRRVYTLVPADPERLHDSEHLPPPIGEDAPGFVDEGEIRGLYDELAGRSLPAAVEGSGPRFLWGLQRGDLLRYNRVEGLSPAARMEWTIPTPLSGPLELRATGRVGLADWTPDATIGATRTSSRRTISLSAYHRVAEVDPRTRGLGPGNSLTGLLFGRDDGDYFRATGARLTWAPAGVRRPWYEVNLSAERHRRLPVATDFSLLGLVGGREASFRPGLPVDEGREYAAALKLEPWWGTDPAGAQGGLEVLVQGALGDHRWLRGRAVARTALPLFGGLRAGLEAGGGHARGEVPVQRAWFLGGTRTLRGYPGASAVGRTYLRGRAELARVMSGVRLSVFSDAGWAGDRRSFDPDDGLVSAGLGASFLDGLVRMDLARALRAPTGWRLELYVDGIL